MLAASGSTLLPPRSRLRTSCESSSSRIATPATTYKPEGRQLSWPPAEELRVLLLMGHQVLLRLRQHIIVARSNCLEGAGH